MRRLLVLAALCMGCSALQPPGNGSEALTAVQRSLASEAEGDSLLAVGMGDQAREAFERAALLREPGDPARHALAVSAAAASGLQSLTVAVLLMEQPDSLSPFLALRIGGFPAAPALLAHLTGQNPVMPEYLGLVLADTLLAHGDLVGTATALSLVPDGLPDAADSKRTELFFMAALLASDGGLSDSILAAVESDDDSELLSILRHRRGMNRLREGIPGAAEELVRSFALWPAAPVHAAAYSALRDELLADPLLAAAVADPFYAGGLWNELHDLAVHSDDPPAHLYYLAARTRDRLGFYGEAASMLENYLESWPAGADAPDAMINLGRNLGRTGDAEGGLAALQEFGRLFPAHARISNLPWYIGDMYAGNRMWEEAEPWFRTMIRDYPGNVTADDAHFHLCFALMETGRTGEAVSELRSFIARWTESVYLSSARYWLGALLLDSGSGEGDSVLLDLIERAPLSLPAGFARERLGLDPWEPAFTEEPLEDWMTRHGNPPAEVPGSAFRGLVLQRAGLRRLAQGEFLRAEEEVGSASRLAPFYMAHDVWERRPMSGYTMWDLPDDPADRPRELWMLRYQEAWPEFVLPYCAEYGLDPLFAWAIVRNESMFQPDCYSTAGARGLIQMIPSTSQYVALEQGWEDYSPDRLYDPAVSLEYGICYIAEVERQLGAGPAVTAAGYNGGPHNAIQWGAMDMTGEEFFSLITFDETRAYAQNVYNAFLTYRALYR
jgi:soluble lytic murein transglycosylase